MKIGIAIVEDNEKTAAQLEEMACAFLRDKKAEFACTVYHSGVEFLDKLNSGTDIVLMDIRMPNMNGMDTAKKMRELAPDVVLIFTTSMAQYAVQGYEVDAINYLLKPVRYADLCYALERALDRIAKREREGKKIHLSTARGVVSLNSSEIVYIEVLRHRLYYHTQKETYDIYGILNEAEDALAPHGFVRSNACYLVNLRYVKWACRYKLVLSFRGQTEELPISRNKYKAFMDRFREYLREGR